MSRALVFNEYGGPEVLSVIQVPVAAPGPGEVRVRIRAAGLQPFDGLFRSGAMRQWAPARFPQRLGNELAGVVEAVGEGVQSVAIGDEVLGWGTLGGAGDHLVLPAASVIGKPREMPWTEAGALSASGQTASTALEHLKVGARETLLVHAAAGGVGSMAVQIACASGARVIGTASGRNHEYLRSLGALPVRYGPGLVERVREQAPDGVDAALVAVGSDEALHASVALVRDRARVATVAFQPLAQALGVARVGTERSRERCERLLVLYREGRLRVSIQEAFRLEDAARAYGVMEAGHVRGKLVFEL